MVLFLIHLLLFCFTHFFSCLLEPTRLLLRLLFSIFYYMFILQLNLFALTPSSTEQARTIAQSCGPASIHRLRNALKSMDPAGGGSKIDREDVR